MCRDGIPPKICAAVIILALSSSGAKRKYFQTSAQGLLRNVTLQFHLRGWITIPGFPSKKKMEFDRLVLSPPPPSPSIGVGMCLIYFHNYFTIISQLFHNYFIILSWFSWVTLYRQSMSERPWGRDQAARILARCSFPWGHDAGRMRAPGGRWWHQASQAS